MKVAGCVADKLIYLPIYPELTDTDIDKISKIKKY